MFTVKHIQSDFTETLYAVQTVTYQPSNFNGAPSPSPESVFLYGGDHGMVTITEGLVYVMNESGSTVGKYDLQAKNGAPSIEHRAGMSSGLAGSPAPTP